MKNIIKILKIFEISLKKFYLKIVSKQTDLKRH